MKIKRLKQKTRKRNAYCVSMLVCKNHIDGLYIFWLVSYDNGEEGRQPDRLLLSPLSRLYTVEL